MIKNLDSLNVKISNISNMDLTKALNRACIAVENTAKINCPVETGALRSSITHEVEDNKGYIGSGLEYAPYVEIGTGLFSSQGDGRDTPWTYKTPDGEWHTTHGQKPQPFLQPALNSNKNKIQKIFREAVKEDIDNWSM